MQIFDGNKLNIVIDIIGTAPDRGYCLGLFVVLFFHI